MKPHELGILTTLEKCLQIINVAVEHHIRQPWVAQQIKVLEKEYGLTLCKTNGRQVIELTEAGRLLLKYTNRKNKKQHADPPTGQNGDGTQLTSS